MRSVRSRNTTPERALRRALWRRGFRYRLQPRTDLPGKPDIVLPRHRVAIFVDGDFWHGRQWRARGFSSLEEAFAGVSNSDYWVRKIRRNMTRDRQVSRELRAEGWHVFRVWESTISKDAQAVAQRLARRIRTP